MIEIEIDIRTDDGEMNTYVVFPDATSVNQRNAGIPDAETAPATAYPVILLLMDASGKRRELETMAMRLATSGYCVALPNLYYRQSKEAAIANREQMNEYMDSLTNELVLEDCKAILQWTDQQPFASNGDAGVVGYCMSGPFAFYAAGHFGERVVAGASIHGVRLMTEARDSPHLAASNITGEFYIGCAESDHWAPVEIIQQLERYVREVDAKINIEWYPETEHGFVFPDRAEKYHLQAAERHWHRLNDLFRRHLQ